MSDMNKEKRAEIIQDALDYLDDDMIENVDKLRMRTKEAATKAGKGRKLFAYSKRYLAVAASVCLLVVGAFAWGNLIGPSDFGDKAPLGTESGDKDYHEPENAPGLNEDMVDGTEYNPGDIDGNNPVDSEGASDSILIDTELITLPGDSTLEESDSKNTQEKDPEEKPNPPESSEPSEPDHYAPLGDAYQLQDNYVKVTMMPHKVWEADMSLDDAVSISREIGSEYYDKLDEFVDALCTTPRLRKTLDAGEPFSQDIYHLFFHRTDGEIVHIWLFSNNAYVYYDADKDFCIDIDTEVYHTIMKVLWMHW